MEFLVECFPVAFGVLLGLSCHRLGGVRQRWVLALAGSITLGAFATLASGEWRVSLLYLLLDMALVSSVCIGTDALLAFRQRRIARRR